MSKNINLINKFANPKVGLKIANNTTINQTSQSLLINRGLVISKVITKAKSDSFKVFRMEKFNQRNGYRSTWLETT